MSIISAHNSPMISIPKKVTEEVDWTGPIRNAIAHSYGEDPDNYATECGNLQRCRQDAVKGAGSDMTGTYAWTFLATAVRAQILCSERPPAQILWPT